MFYLLQISHSRTLWSDSESGDHSWRIECRSNTWSHQRRRRRQMIRAEQQSQAQNTSLTNATVALETYSSDDASLTPKRHRLDPSVCAEEFGDKSTTPVHNSSDVSTVIPQGTTLNPMSSASEDLGVKNTASKDESAPPAKRLRLDPTLRETEPKESSEPQQDRTSDSAVDSMASDGGDTVIMVCSVAVRKADFVKLEMSWVGGQNRELMHQLLQFIKNRFV